MSFGQKSDMRDIVSSLVHHIREHMMSVCPLKDEVNFDSWLWRCSPNLSIQTY